MSGQGSGRPAAVVVTGSAGAIGSAVVATFTAAGFETIGIDLAPPAQRPQSGYRHIQADVRDASSMDDLAYGLVADGVKVSHVVGVAGGAIAEEVGITEIEKLDAELFRRSLELNLVSQYVTVRALLPAVRAAGVAGTTDRSFTVISSVNGLIGMDMPAYSAAKAGLAGMVRVLARMLGPESIRVNGVAPGTVPTPRTERVWARDPDHFERLRRQSPIGRLTTPSEVADSVYAVAVKLTAITGQMIVVDAGQTSTWT